MIDPSSTWVGPDAQVGRDTIIYPSTMIMGTTQIGEEVHRRPQHAPHGHARGQPLRY